MSSQQFFLGGGWSVVGHRGGGRGSGRGGLKRQALAVSGPAPAGCAGDVQLGERVVVVLADAGTVKMGRYGDGPRAGVPASGPPRGRGLQAWAGSAGLGLRSFSSLGWPDGIGGVRPGRRAEESAGSEPVAIGCVLRASGTGADRERKGKRLTAWPAALGLTSVAAWPSAALASATGRAACRGTGGAS